MTRNKREYFTGCLLGGAAGDALGWPVEFEHIEEIKKKYGPNGIVDMVANEHGLHEITDDTQMTLFTADGLLQAWSTSRRSGSAPNFTAAVKRSYRCWLATQGEAKAVVPSGKDCQSWLLKVEGLYRRRAPGNTCLSALREDSLLKNSVALNNSKGCGGIMRAAPAGLIASRINKGNNASTARLAFEIGSATAALTHGHPSGYYPAGVLAAVIATIISGGTIEEGINVSISFLNGRTGAKETIDAIQAALALWQNQDATPSPEIVTSLGGGWVGEEALAISLYCALVASDNFIKGVQLAVNHSGDSDSTGSITGNILGAMLGEQALPHDWLIQLEQADVIRQIGDDLFTTFENTERWQKNYPLRTNS